jgi:hypothetical protein
MKLPSTPPALIGTAVHASTAAFDQAVISHERRSADDCLDVAFDILNNPQEEVDWLGESAQAAGKILVKVHMDYCNNVAPKQEYVLVERQLPPLPIKMSDNVTIIMTGTLDRVRRVGGKIGVVDVKTGARVVSADGDVKVGKHAAQLASYTLLAEQYMGEELTLPPAIIGLQTQGKAQAGMGSAEHTKEALLGSEGSPGLLDYATNYFTTGLFPPNPSSFLCSPRYCPFYSKCKFHG